MKERRPSPLQRIGVCVLALPFAIPITVAFAQKPDFHPILPIIFVASFCVSFLVLNWAFFDRPEKLKKKLPINSKELQREQKEFYDSLPR
jgi:hypothetical protein